MMKSSWNHCPKYIVCIGVHRSTSLARHSLLKFHPIFNRNTHNSFTMVIKIYFVSRTNIISFPAQVSTLDCYGVEYHLVRNSAGLLFHMGIGPEGIRLYDQDWTVVKR